MVRWLIFLLPFLLIADEVVIETLPDNDRLVEGRPIEGTLVVTYPADKALETSAFSYQKKPLHVDFVRRVSVKGANPLNVDSFRFKLPPLPSGLHTISPISVRLDGTSYSSVPVAIKVQDIELAKEPEKGAAKASLKLESVFVPEGPLFPGQKALVGYRYLFSGDIELKEEKLPLLDQDDFVKLGEKYVEERQEGDVSIREVLQRIEFDKPGDFDIAAGKAAGYRVQDRGWGPKQYFEPLLETETEALKVVVKPFPEEGKPPFFQGALGPFALNASVKAPPRLERGDRLIFNLAFEGAGVHSTLKPINLLCLPGWAGFFRTGDLPPQEQGGEKKTVFSYELRPSTTLVDTVPPVFFAYFDPVKEAYSIVKTDPIPLKVEETYGIEVSVPEEPVTLKMNPILPNEGDLERLLAEIPSYDSIPKSPPPGGTSHVLLLIPLALFILWFRLFLDEHKRD